MKASVEVFGNSSLERKLIYSAKQPQLKWKLCTPHQVANQFYRFDHRYILLTHYSMVAYMERTMDFYWMKKSLCYS